MPPTDADTIRILVSTDNHVGYNERDPVRGDDSWKSFHEVMCLAKERDVDMVLLAGDLFHENKPSRKSMYQVMRSLRMNCFGDKPCELEMLSDASENFQGAFNHVNYEDMDINVAIPVFSIHGNHDDPSGEGHLAALDLLQVSGLINYYGRTPESDNIQIKPVLLQKGRTKLALFGMSNVRDERLFRTFRDGKVKFFRPSMQQEDWFNLMSVHQNHHAHTETGYLPETFLPDFLDLVIWGHEHECLINPRLNPETNFHVMQPGSSVATSLVPGEAVPKHVSILSITGREFKSEPILLKSVRPFVTREVILSEEKEMQKVSRKEDTRTETTRFLMGIVEEMIEEAKNEWLEQREGVDDDEESTFPLPLVRVKVETSKAGGGNFDCENPQRFSNRFVGKVANVNDVVQFHRKKKGTALARGKSDAPDESAVSHLVALDAIKVEQLVREFLTAQSLTILPQNSFGDAVSQFVDKDDKYAMEMFVNDSLESQIKHLMNLDRDQDGADPDDDEREGVIQAAMDKYREQLEEVFAKGKGRRTGGKKRFKPKPDGWDTEFDGVWEDQPGALLHSDHEADGNGEEEEQEAPARAATTSRRRGASATTSTSTRGRVQGTLNFGRSQASQSQTVAGTSGSGSSSRPTRAAATRAARSVSVMSDGIEDDDDDDDAFDPAPIGFD
ncbi:double-strand break repair protein mus-23 [Arthroderma uncinatum]|uniref:double-strand break repair protein mus-23 n=1 Tax=Arthroderma uncinatum TaxID=74035 RepID=UPI00144A88A3|nr:double-strand break repair protein mus-23 [Arthroderma uncinatum]KAF3490796.1 double-strand break repair protein mus-23 [Arthroderma uncinatum]